MKDYEFGLGTFDTEGGEIGVIVAIVPDCSTEYDRIGYVTDRRKPSKKTPAIWNRYGRNVEEPANLLRPTAKQKLYAWLDTVGVVHASRHRHIADGGAMVTCIELCIEEGKIVGVHLAPEDKE